MTNVARVACPIEDSGPADHAARLRLFAPLWALAALFHIAGNAPYGQILPAPTPRGICILLLGLAAASLLISFRVWLLVTIAGLTVVTAWLEAPTLGNHWLLAAIISSVLLAALWPDPSDMATVARRFVPVAAAVTIVSYGFMAFSKLNTGFLDPSVSCAVHFASRLATSWGFLSIEAATTRTFVIATTLAAELSLPALLAIRRTRMIGVIVGIAFHGFIALDLRQHIWDFSSVLLALFLLFAPETLVKRALTQLSRPRRLLAVAAWLIVLLTLALPPAAISRVIIVGVGHLMWFATVGTLFIMMVRHFQAGGAWPDVVLPRWPGRAWLVLPLLALVNGLAPYFEIKTATAFNMYANLRTAQGNTNHLLVPRTWPLTAVHDRLVVVLSTDDQRLGSYIGSGYALPWEEFRAYLQTRPAAAVTYERGGVIHQVTRAGDDPALMAPVSEVRRRLLAARAVDLTDPPRCQASWGPAR